MIGPERYCQKCKCRCHCYDDSCPNCPNDVCIQCECEDDKINER